jgi:Asp-tRNA(Asn)/Glu-tRNA(Gln) amidotransferase A subunit family amidase
VTERPTDSGGVDTTASQRNSPALRRRTFNGLLLAAVGSAIAPGLTAGNNDISRFYDSADATAMAQAIRKGDILASELLEEAIRRAERAEAAFNILTMEHYELARQQLAAGTPGGPFGGVPFLLKDMGITLKDTITTNGSRMLATKVASKTAELVKRYQRAGVVIFGKTNVPEYGLALTTENLFTGDCLNPWNRQYSTGGSSGGSAAAVAAGVLPMAHATDGGGSIRAPANHCGVFGFKPTRGLTPDPSGAGMSVGHVVSRSVRDSAAMMDASAGYVPGAPYGVGLAANGHLAATQQEPGKLRIALNLTVPDVDIHPDCRAAVLATAKLLEGLGHSVEEAAPDLNYDQLNATQNTLISVNVATTLKSIEKARGKAIAVPDIEPMTAMLREYAAGYTQYDYARALNHMHAIGRTMGTFQQRHDLVLQPVTATPAPKLGTITYRDGDSLDEYTARFKKVSAFTHLYNMSGQPSVSLPLAMSGEGLPIGVMLSGRVGEDRLLFSVCAQIERATPWQQRRPDLGGLYS